MVMDLDARNLQKISCIFKIRWLISFPNQELLRITWNLRYIVEKPLFSMHLAIFVFPIFHFDRMCILRRFQPPLLHKGFRQPPRIIKPLSLLDSGQPQVVSSSKRVFRLRTSIIRTANQMARLKIPVFG